MKTTASLVFLFSLLVFLIGIVDAKCLRCRNGRELACVGDSKYDFIAKCGNPDYSEEVGEETTGSVGGYYSGSVNLNTSKIEKMQYNCGDGEFMVTVTVRKGRVTSIENGARGYGPVRCE